MSHRVLPHWPVMIVSLLIASCIAAIGVVFYIRSNVVMSEEIRDRLSSVAGAAAVNIDGDLLNAIHSEQDIEKAEYKSLALLLQEIRQLPGVRFAYILRKTDDPMMLSFVADADTTLTAAELDLNKNSTIDEDEEPALPGQLYDVSEYPPLQGPAFAAPTADEEITYDQWGALVSGYAPIRSRSTGEVVAVLGIDMRAEDFVKNAQRAFSPFTLLLVFLAAFLIAALVAYVAERRQAMMIRHMNDERSGLLRLTFHQLGEPLTIMKWSLETLREETDSPELKNLVDEHVLCMDEGLGRLNSIIDTLQFAERVDLDTLQYLPVPASLRPLIENAVNEWKSSLDKRRQKIEVIMDEDVTMPIDSTLIALVLRQLLVNAIEYSPDESTIRIRVTQHRKAVVVSVEDEGCGIPAKDMALLFQKYRRASNAHLQKPDGNGLGLYIAKGIIDKAGGTIDVQSMEGRGTTVKFTLPM